MSKKTSCEVVHIDYLTELQNRSERLTRLERENAELREDKARLDWLEKISSWYGISGETETKVQFAAGGVYPLTVRAAIDAARQNGERNGESATQRERTSPMTAETPTCVYELVDATNDEAYFTIGLFTDPDAAIKFAREGERPVEGDGACVEEYVEFVLRKRPLDKFSGTGHQVSKICWQEYYDEANDEYKWKVVKNDR